MSKLRIIAVSAELLIMVMALFLARDCYSSTSYKYIDKDGTACFTDNRRSIPEEYKRKAIKIIDEKENIDEKSGDTHLKGDSEGGPFIEKKQESSEQEKVKETPTTPTNSSLFNLVAAIIIFLSLFILIGKIGGSLGFKHISSVLRIALTAGILLYLFHTHLQQLVNTFDLLKKDVTNITRQAEQRNKEMEDAAKDQPGQDIPAR